MFKGPQITAAALAYLAARDVKADCAIAAAEAWRRAHPEHFAELEERMKRALEAAAATPAS